MIILRNPTRAETAVAIVAIFSVAFLFAMGVVATAKLAFDSIDGARCAPEFYIVDSDRAGDGT